MFVPIFAGVIWILVFGSSCLAAYQGAPPQVMLAGFIVANLALSIVFLIGAGVNLSRMGRHH